MHQKHNIHNIPTRKSYQRRRRGYQYLFSLWALILIHWSSAVWAAPDPTVVTTLAGSTSGFADGTGTAAQFNFPAAVAADTAGNLYVADADNNRIRKIVLATGVVTTLAGSTRGYLDATGTAARFYNPYGVAVDTAGNLYVADAYNYRIRKIVLATGVVTTLAGSGTAGLVDGTNTDARFNFPGAVAVDTAGNLYVTDYDNSNSLIRKIVIATGVVTTLAGSSSGYAEGTGTSAHFDGPRGVAVDTAGNLYVADRDNNRIRKIDTAGVVTTLAGDGTAAFADGTGTAARFNQPRGVAADTAGNLYVTDADNQRIRKIVLATGVVTTLAGNGTAAFADGTGPAAQFNEPRSVAVDTAGNLYVADSVNHRIRKMMPPAAFSSTPAPASTINVGTATISSSVSTTLSISETGTAQLDVTSLALSGTDAAEFSVSPSTAFSIADGGGAQTVTLTCTPTTAGSKTATLTVTHNGTGTVSSPVTYTLNCTGTASLTYTVTPPLPEQLSLFLQVDGKGHGKVTTDTGLSCLSSDCQVDIKSGDLKCNPQNCTQLEKTVSDVTLTPQADADSVFSSWGGNEDCIDGQVFMNGGKLCIAYFHRIYSLTVATQGSGQITGYDSYNEQPILDCGTKCQTSVSDGTRLSLQATPAQGMTFLGWSGDCGTSTLNPLPVAVDKEMKCQATFVTPAPIVTPTPVTTPPPVTSTPLPVVPTTPVVTPPVTTTPETTPAVTTETTGKVPSTTPITPAVTTETTSNVPTTSPVMPVTTDNVPTTTVETTPPPVVISTPVVTPAPIVVTPPLVVTLLPVTIIGTNYACPTTGDIGEVCNYGGQEVTNLNVQGSGIVSNGLVNTTVVNTGWVSNFHITATGKLRGGVVTGYIKNEGVMLDFDFKGMSIIGGTLGGVITNTSKVGGYFQDVTLQPGTKITGGTLSGIIKGDKDQPALLENVRVKGRSKLSGVKLGKNVKLEKGVVVKDK